MAESSKLRSGSDKVDEFLIWKTSNHAKHNRLNQIASYLRLEEHIKGEIITDFKDDSKEKRFRVNFNFF